uniref:Multidrug resistance protein, MATE family n=1 Tax=Candidatus Kentrum sp. LFY TaxID=2126342 RepID=A0A450UKJ7_9GAMM|nr:MAG: multidrug resistance protein, MATE family [Candidatus Kentron sp. LFY]
MTDKPESKFPALADLRVTLQTALPLGIGYMGSMLIGVTDSIMLGHFSPEALGAAGLALSICNIILVIGWGMIFPMLVLVSRRCGTECPQSRIPSKIIRQNLWVCGILFVPACVVLWNTTPILLLTGQDPLLARMAGQYMDYYLWSLFPMLARYGFALALTAMHRTGIIALITWLEVGLNIVLDYGLIFGKFGFPELGIAGAGLASIIVYGFGHTVFFFSIFDFRRFPRSLLIGRLWRPSRDILGQFLRIGWPKSLELLVINTIFSVFALLAGWIGTQAVAAYTIALQTITVVTYTLPWAVADIVTVRVTAALAQKSRPGMWRALNSGIVILFFLLFPSVAVFWLFPEWIVVLFVGSEPREAQALLPLASPLIVLVGLFVIVDGLRTVGGQGLNGLSDMKIPALIAGLAYWGISLPLGAWLGFVMDLGVRGFWIGLILGIAITAIGYLNRFRRLLWNLEATPSG